jgi:hypothetical protein
VVTYDYSGAHTEEFHKLQRGGGIHTMRKNLRILFDEIRAAGLGVEAIEERGKHQLLRLKNGRVLFVSRGSRLDKNLTRIWRHDIRRAANKS